jgi:hypothetical protein
MLRKQRKENTKNRFSNSRRRRWQPAIQIVHPSSAFSEGKEESSEPRKIAATDVQMQISIKCDLMIEQSNYIKYKCDALIENSSVKILKTQIFLEKKYLTGGTIFQPIFIKYL